MSFSWYLYWLVNVYNPLFANSSWFTHLLHNHHLVPHTISCELLSLNIVIKPLEDNSTFSYNINFTETQMLSTLPQINADYLEGQSPSRRHDLTKLEIKAILSSSDWWIMLVIWFKEALQSINYNFVVYIFKKQIMCNVRSEDNVVMYV